MGRPQCLPRSRSEPLTSHIVPFVCGAGELKGGGGGGGVGPTHDAMSGRSMWMLFFVSRDTLIRDTPRGA